MATVIKMPVLGQSVEEVRILQWFKSEGDTVEKGERLAEIETDKTNMDFDSPESGVIQQILAPADSYVKVEAPILIVSAAGEVAPPLPGTSEANGKANISPRARRVADEFGVAIADLGAAGTGPNGRVIERDVIAFYEARQTEEANAAAQIARDMEAVQKTPKASPLARAVAENTGADLSALAGTGANGRIVAGDVRAGDVRAGADKAALASPIETAETGTRTVTISGLRKRVADNLTRSIRNAPHVTLHLQADMTEAMRLRQELLPAIEKAVGVRLSPTDIIIKACATALKAHPALNAHREGDTMTLFEAVHIGLAVSLGDDGLVVPVIKNAHQKGLSDLARARAEIVTCARDNKLTGADLTGGTFTVTNLGNFGIDAFNPIIAPPQVAILGVGAIADAVVAKNGVPTVRPMTGLSLSFDHAALDGAPAAAFLAQIKEILETPTLLLV